MHARTSCDLRAGCYHEITISSATRVERASTSVLVDRLPLTSPCLPGNSKQSAAETRVGGDVKRHSDQCSLQHTEVPELWACESSVIPISKLPSPSS
jgi:hypothetical protein